ncbi:unnamed protein product [Urochloa decumbens]|uniref:FAS1 domain-containing protein n=1 Tax=Urochloa decumbens TaxID=240449 RepID=A0ABC8XNN3_9POAL
MHRPAARRKRRLSPLRPRRPLPPPRILAVTVASASTLLFLSLVLLSTSPPSPSRRLAISGRRSSPAARPRCGAAGLGELGDAMVAMLPRDLPFTVFVPSPGSFRRVLKMQGRPTNGSAAAADAEGGGDSTDAVLSRVLGFSAVPRRLLAPDVPSRGAATRLVLDSVSGLRIHVSRDGDARGALVVNGVRSECVDVVRGETVVHVVAGVLMDAEFERSFAVDSDG